MIAVPPARDRGQEPTDSDITHPTERSERTSRRQRRSDNAARERAALRDRRRSEPASPLGVIAVVVLLAVIVLGVGGGLPRLFGKESNDQGPVGLLTPSGVAVNEPETSRTSVSAVPGSTTEPLTTPPPQTERPGAAATVAADNTTRSWANLFYKRSPATETYEQLVNRAQQFTTPELAASFASAGDATYEALRSSGGTSEVLSVTITTPRADTAPTDTQTRITRLVTVKIRTTGKDPGTFDVPLLVTVFRDEQRWLVGSIDGGTGP
ncbi:hypothetical protein AB0L64_25910 [Kribbella sp. NPDC051936]|uniref:hypothetical protein n=1 Tax=Kribbella sp. NPDC051936 TaxID=3154946 RepID=UPI00341EA05D